MIVIGLHGRIGAGKNHIAEAIRLIRKDSTDRKGFQYNQRVYTEEESFANPLKAAVSTLFSISIEDTRTQEGKNKPTSYHWEHLSPSLRNKFPDRTGPMLVREILQIFGSDTMRELWGDDFWVRRMRETLEKHLAKREEHRTWKTTPVVITDVRHRNEAELVREYGEVWHVVPVDMPIKTLLNKNTCAAHHQHSSEQQLPKDLIDLTVYNSFRDFEATKAVLRENLDRLLKADACK